jgi:hypothetical protein
MIYRAAVCLGLVACSLFGAGPAPPKNVAVHRVNPRNTYFRVVGVVPLTGTGTNADPIRPEYVPAPPALGAKSAKAALTGIIGFGFVMSDDKKHAIVEFVARDRAAFNGIMADKRPDVKVFAKGTAKRADIEVELKKYKKDLDLDRLMVRVP